jgi:hypothetical protein
MPEAKHRAKCPIPVTEDEEEDERREESDETPN